MVFKLLGPERDYTVDKQINGGKGCLRFLDSMQIQDGDQVGIYLQTDNTLIIPTKGDTTTTKMSSASSGEVSCGFTK